MTNHHARLYVLALALVIFFLGWAVVAAHPWVKAGADPRLRVLSARETHLRHEAVVVRRIVAARWAHYRVQLNLREKLIASAKAQSAAISQQAAAAPVPVQVVNLPAHVITRTS
jgi:hypothetical protein